jgi:hypothetical protein
LDIDWQDPTAQAEALARLLAGEILQVMQGTA